MLLPNNYRFFNEQDRHQKRNYIEKNMVTLTMLATEDGKWHVQSESGNNPDEFSVSKLPILSCNCQSISSEIICTQKECKFFWIHMYKCDLLCTLILILDTCVVSRDRSITLVLVLKSALSTFFEELDGACCKHFTNIMFVLECMYPSYGHSNYCSLNLGRN